MGIRSGLLFTHRQTLILFLTATWIYLQCCAGEDSLWDHSHRACSRETPKQTVSSPWAQSCWSGCVCRAAQLVTWWCTDSLVRQRGGEEWWAQAQVRRGPVLHSWWTFVLSHATLLCTWVLVTSFVSYWTFCACGMERHTPIPSYNLCAHNKSNYKGYFICAFYEWVQRAFLLTFAALWTEKQDAFELACNLYAKGGDADAEPDRNNFLKYRKGKQIQVEHLHG